MKQNAGLAILPFRKPVPLSGDTPVHRAGAAFRRRFFLAAGLFCCVFRPGAAAEITIDRLEMASRGRVQDEKFVLSSEISADLALTGGYKYAFLLGFSLETTDISRAFAYGNSKAASIPPANSVTGEEYNMLVERLNNQAFLGFRVAKATVRDIFGIPLEMSYFLGSADDFCTGDEFGTRFGLSPFGTEYRGFFYFPDSIRYEGIYGVRGTGLSFSLTTWEKAVTTLYIYKDFILPAALSGTTEEDLYSGDLRFLFHHNWFRMEAFAGVSVDPDLDKSVRGGLMLHLGGNGVEFFAQSGIPGWIIEEEFGISNLFFLLEPRLRFKFFSLAVTFFYHPSEYIHLPTEEEGRADLNIKFLFGNTDPEALSGFAGGIEVGGEFPSEGIENTVLRVAPFGSFFSGGLRWDVKFPVYLLDNDPPAEMFELFIGVRTAF